MSASKNFLTQEWYEKLVKELHVLKTETLLDIIEQIKEAKAEWDLSENAEYHSAKEKQALIQKRISDLEGMIKDVEIISSENEGGSDSVRYGSKVKVRMENWKEFDFRIVGSAEVAIDPELHISFESPVWRAIEGKSVGDSVFVRLQEGRLEMKILSVK